MLGKTVKIKRTPYLKQTCRKCGNNFWSAKGSNAQLSKKCGCCTLRPWINKGRPSKYRTGATKIWVCIKGKWQLRTKTA
jgi:hypothetical protein